MANNQLFARFGTDADNKLSKVSTIAFRNGAASRKAMATNNGQARTAKTRILIADDDGESFTATDECDLRRQKEESGRVARRLGAITSNRK